MSRKPILVGSLMLGIGYAWAAVRRQQRPIPNEMVDFRQKEQMERLKSKFHLKRRRDYLQRVHGSQTVS